MFFAINIYELGVFVYRNKNVFNNNDFLHGCSTGISNLLFPKDRLNLFGNDPFYIGTSIFNSLPGSLKLCNSENKLKIYGMIVY